MSNDLTLPRSARSRPAPEARFWDRVAGRYAAKPVADEAAYRRKLAITRDLLRPHMRLLEIGCGTGSTAILHAPFVDQVRAVDVSPRMLGIARERARAAGIDNISFECTAFDALRVTGASVDAVLALSLLHLLRDWRGAILRIHGMLAPGGLFVSSTACLGDGAPLLRPVAPLGHALGLLPQLAFFRRATLEAAVADAGFEIEHAWRPSPRQGLFLVARKAGRPA